MKKIKGKNSTPEGAKKASGQAIRYIHTIDEKPGQMIFEKNGAFICGASRNTPINSYRSLRELKRNQAKSVKWDTDNYEQSPGFRYGWVKIRI